MSSSEEEALRDVAATNHPRTIILQLLWKSKLRHNISFGISVATQPLDLSVRRWRFYDPCE